MRIDKFLKVSRLIKRRTVAKEACDQSRITINGRPAKAGSGVDIGDIITIQFGNGSVSAKVLKVSEASRKEDAGAMYEIVQSDRALS
jgi:ribosomal 50S subunit-recycling heat shock protein